MSVKSAAPCLAALCISACTVPYQLPPHDKASFDEIMAMAAAIEADQLPSMPEPLRRYAALHPQPRVAEATAVLKVMESRDKEGRLDNKYAWLETVTAQRDGWRRTVERSRKIGRTYDGTETDGSVQWSIDAGLVSNHAARSEVTTLAHKIVGFQADGAMFPLRDGGEWGYFTRARDGYAVNNPDVNSLKPEVTDKDLLTRCRSSRAPALDPLFGPLWTIECRGNSTDAKGPFGPMPATRWSSLPPGSIRHFAPELGVFVEPEASGAGSSGAFVTRTAAFAAGDRTHGVLDLQAATTDGRRVREAKEAREREKEAREREIEMADDMDTLKDILTGLGTIARTAR